LDAAGGCAQQMPAKYVKMQLDRTMLDLQAATRERLELAEAV
jgi:hypothetical protein